jgi:adenylate cyclase
LLKISKIYDEDKKELKITVNQVKDSLHKTGFQFPIEIKEVTNGQAKYFNILISKENEEFVIPIDSKTELCKI